MERETTEKYNVPSEGLYNEEANSGGINNEETEEESVIGMWRETYSSAKDKYDAAWDNRGDDIERTKYFGEEAINKVNNWAGDFPTKSEELKNAYNEYNHKISEMVDIDGEVEAKYQETILSAMLEAMQDETYLNQINSSHIADCERDLNTLVSENQSIERWGHEILEREDAVETNRAVLREIDPDYRTYIDTDSSSVADSVSDLNPNSGDGYNPNPDSNQEGSVNPNTSPDRGSLIDDFADVMGEMPSYTEPED